MNDANMHGHPQPEEGRVPPDEKNNKSGSESSLSQDGNVNFEEDPEFLEYQERADIVAKYDKGTEGQDIDPWENPDFSLYHVTDRFGFVHEKELRDPDREEQLARKKELDRERKWMKMLFNWDKFYRSIKLRDRVRKGVPDKFRAELWKKVLGVDELKSENAGVYDQLTLRARLLAKDLKQIDMDINRTYRDHLFFRKRYDLKQQSLLHVLGAYSMYNTEVGYCQGMSQIAALMLMYLTEEDAFWALHILMVDQRHAMHGFFVPGFPKLLRYQTHFETIIRKYLSRLKKHMDKLQVPLIYTTKWWFGCFLDRVPFTLALRLWDMFIVEGEIVMVAMSYNILKMHQKILRRANFEETLDILQNQLAEEFGYSDLAVIDSLVDCMRKLRGDYMHLPPPPVHNGPSETPTKKFGEVLKRPLDDIHRSISAIQSRRTSRAPSMSHSTPGTPRHGGRSKSHERNVQRAVKGLILTEGINSSHFNDRRPGNNWLEPNNPDNRSQPSYSRSAEPLRTELNGTEETANNPNPPLKSVGSFYDNVPDDTGMDMDGNGRLDDSFHSQESEYKNEKFVRPDGTVVYQAECTITKTEVETRTVSSNRSSAAFSTPSTTPVQEGMDFRDGYGGGSFIRQGPNHVTYVEVVPESGHVMKPRRFPVPNELKTGSSRQTQV